MTIKMLSKSLLFAACVLLSSHSATASPPTTGPLLPRPINLREAGPFLNAKSELSDLFSRASNNNQFAGFTANNASFSVAITSFSTLEKNAVLWDYHHLAPQRDFNGTNNTNGNSQYLIGSISKVFTDLLVLQHLDTSAPITTYLPELNTSVTIQWNRITVQNLMDHLSGIPQNYGFPEIFSLVPLYQQLGFPQLNHLEFPSCGVIDLNSGCNETSLLEALASADVNAVFSPNYSPSYINLAFAVLGLALARETNQSYSDLIATLSSSLNMQSTGISTGNTSLAVIPPPDPVTGIPSSWGSNFGVNAPQGGLYSTTNDMARFMRAIISHDTRILSTSSEIDGWLKPHSMTSMQNVFVGAPWEIYRLGPGKLSSRIDTTVDLYVKDGGVVGYSSRMILIPSYGIGVIVLTAGPTGRALEAVSEAVVAKVIPAVDEVARRQARRVYAESYESIGREVEMNFTVSIDDGPGMRVKELHRNGSDILFALRVIQQSSVVVASRLSEEWRVYPARWGAARQETIRDQNRNERRVDVEEWRLNFNPTPLIREQERKESGLLRAGKGVFKDAVGSWLGIDSVYYGGEAADRFECWRAAEGDTRGDVLGWRFPALRGVMWRVDG